MNSTSRSTSGSAHRPRSGGRYSFAHVPLPVRVAYAICLSVLTLACVMTALAIFNDAYFGVVRMCGLIAVVAAANLLFGATAWRYRRQLGRAAQLFVIDWMGAALWFLLCAPLYQLVIVHMNAEQIRLSAFCYCWEVPVIGVVGHIVGQASFRSLAKYVSTSHSDDPQRLYRVAVHLPFFILLRAAIASMVGFSLAALQVHVFAHLPMYETYKMVAAGAVVTVFIVIFYYLVADSMAGPIKSKLVTQYGLQDMVRARYHHKVFALVVMLTVGALSLTGLFFVTMIQKVNHETVTSAYERNMARFMTPTDLTDPVKLEKIRLNKSGKAFVQPADQTLPISSVSEETAKYFTTHASGQIDDTDGSQKIIAFKTIDDQKLVAVAYLSDYYSTFNEALLDGLLASLFVVGVIVIITAIFVRLLNDTLLRLSRALDGARKTGAYREPGIHTGDEFEALSHGLAHFVHQTQRSTKGLIEEHARLNASISSLQLGVLMIDMDDSVLRANQAFQAILGLTEAETASLSSITQRLGEALRLSSYISQSRTRQRPIHFHGIAYGAKYLDIFVAPVTTENSALIGFMVVVQDVTEDSVMQRSKDEFFSIASHELRTPLTAIRGNASMITTFYEEILTKNPELAQMIDDIKASSERLISIVSDFLDVSRLEQGKMGFRLEEFAIDKTIEAVVYDMQSSVTSKRLTLTIDEKRLGLLPMVWADEERIKQVLYNLIGNAIKFTRKGGITIQPTLEGNEVKIRVVDTGPGIAVDAQKLLFRKFQQASKSLITRDATRGTGLGLYISKFIVENLGGKMELESSTVGKGTTFSFTVPIANTKNRKRSVKGAQIDPKTGIQTPKA